MTFPVRLGVLGAAKIAKRSVLPAVKALSNHFTLVAIASREESKAQELATAFDCQAVVGYEALLERNDIDAVYVPLPTGLHGHWVAEALKCGLHVYAEKSFARNADEATSLVDLARDYGVAAMEGYMFLHHPQLQAIRRMIDNGAIGDLRHFQASFGFPPLPIGDFRYDELIGGGVLMDAAGYPIRISSQLLGDDLEVGSASINYAPESGTSMWGSAYLRSPSRPGLAASVAFGFDNHYQCRMEAWGSRGKLSAERIFTAGPEFQPIIQLATIGGVQQIEVAAHDHFRSALIHFSQLIHEQEARSAEFDAIVRQARLIEALRRLGTMP